MPTHLQAAHSGMRHVRDSTDEKQFRHVDIRSETFVRLVPELLSIRLIVNFPT